MSAKSTRAAPQPSQAPPAQQSQAPDDSRHDRDELVRSYLHKGAEITEQLLRDNQALEQRASDLNDENAGLREENGKLRAQLASSDAVRELFTTIENMKHEQQRLLERSGEIQRAFSQNEQRQSEVERELNDLASLYIAGFQLGSTLSLVRVVKHMCELMEQLVGAQSFVLYLLSEDGRRGIPVGAHGKLPPTLGSVELEDGPIADACLTGIMRVTELDGPRTPHSVTEPIVVLPIMFASQAVGVIAVYELLPHKKAWAKVDRELFKLLSVHGATALIAANLYAKEAGPRAALHDVLLNLETERHQQLVAADPDVGGAHE